MEPKYYKYAFKVEYWDEDAKAERKGYGVLWAKTSTEAMSKLAEFYGEDNLNSVMLIMEDEDPVLFTDEYVFDNYIRRNEPFSAY